jgi:hypothetical protein
VKIFRTLSSIVNSLQSYKAEKHKKTPSKMCFNIFLKLCNELTIKHNILKIFTALLLANVNLRRPQTTKSALGFQKSISLNENENKIHYIHTYYIQLINF